MTEAINNLPLFKLCGEIWQRRKWLLVTTFLPLVAAAFALIRALPPLYQTSTTILVGQSDILETMVVNGGSNEIEQRLAVARQELLSRSQLEEVIVQFDLYPGMRMLASRQAVLERMRSDIGIEQGTIASYQRPAYPITISYRHWDPDTAAAVANELADRYTRKNREIRQDQVAGTASFLRERLKDVKQRLQEREAVLNQFKINHLGELPEQQNINLATLERLNAELQLNGEKQIQLLDRYNNLTVGMNNADGVTAGSGLSRLEFLKQQLVGLRTRYTSQHPEVVRIKTEIARLENSEADASAEAEAPALPQPSPPLLSQRGTLAETQRELAGLSDQENQLRSRITELQDRLDSIPRIDQELQQLTRDHDIVREEFADLQARYRSASLMESVAGQQDRQFTVLEEALPPEFPREPGRMGLMVMSLIMAGACAGGLVCLREQFDTSFHSLRDLGNYTAVPVLGSITVISTPYDKMRQGFGFLSKTLLFALCLIGIVLLFDFAGERMGQQFVWLLAGRLG